MINISSLTMALLRIILLLCLSSYSVTAQIGEQLPPWQEGIMDIHHISTGRGNSTFFVFPDSTTMLIDAGDISDTHPRTLSTRNSTRKPNSTRTTAGWISDYISHYMPGKVKPSLDYAVITHYHDDHFGEWDTSRAKSKYGDYALTGIMEVGNIIPIKTLLDRGTDFPIDIRSEEFLKRAEKDEYHTGQTLREYWKFINYQSAHNGLNHLKFSPGSRDQIILKKTPAKYPEWQIRNIAVNGQVWTGYADNESTSLFKSGQYPGENPLSTCVKITYGKFDYFTGGDIAGMNGWGESDAGSLESNVAPIIGPVDIATLNHHGNRDSQSPAYVRAIRPRVWVQQGWSSDHPGEEVLRRITSETLYPGVRDLFTTDMLEANKLVIGDRIDNVYKSQHGHIVVRVFDRGSKYMIYILNDLTERREVKAMFGPYNSR